MDGWMIFISKNPFIANYFFVGATQALLWSCRCCVFTFSCWLNVLRSNLTKDIFPVSCICLKTCMCVHVQCWWLCWIGFTSSLTSLKVMRHCNDLLLCRYAGLFIIFLYSRLYVFVLHFCSRAFRHAVLVLPLFRILKLLWNFRGRQTLQPQCQKLCA